MPATSRKYAKDELAQRGDALFESAVKSLIPEGHADDFVVIDVDSGLFEFDSDPLAAADRLDVRVPNAQVWMRKVGSPFVCRFGSPRRDNRP